MTFKYYNTGREVLSLFLTAFIEPFIYHPLIMFFSLKGYFSYITSRELAWGTMTRKGFDNDDDKKKANKVKAGEDRNADGSKKPGVFDKIKNNNSGTEDFKT